MLVAEYTGSSDSDTQSFNVEKGWELRYEIESGHLKATLVDANGKSVADLMNADGPGGGSVYPSQTGTFSLHVVANGAWTIRIFNH